MRTSILNRMTRPLLTRAPHKTHPPVTLTGDIALAPGRVHEACGPSRRSFAALLAARTAGPVLWIAPAWEADGLNMPGLAPICDPARFVFVSPRRAEDVLWVMEETLRAGCVPLAVADCSGLPGLTQVRRMHLAAETGAEAQGIVPLGLLLTPGTGGAPGVESRWHLTPALSPEPRPQSAPPTPDWQLTRLRARTAPQKAWHLSGLPTGTLRAAPAGELAEA